MRVFITPTARAELAAIGDWIAQDDPNRAEHFTLELLNQALALAGFPTAFPLVEHYQHRGVRRRLHRPYLILYRIMADTIEVLHIVHGARDISALLAADEFDV